MAATDTSTNTARLTTPMKWFVALLVLAVILALGLPPDVHTMEQLHISALTYRLAVAVLLVPYAIIWWAGFYAFDKLQEYTRYLRRAAEGGAFRAITRGMGVLAFGLVVPTIVSLVLSAISRSHPGFEPASTIISNYLTLLVPMVAFSSMSSGSRRLVGTTRKRPAIFGMRLFAGLFIVLSVTYGYLMVRNQQLHGSTYHLNMFWLLATLVVPYLYTWFLGLISAFEFKLYSRHVRGLLYRRALVQFSSGIATAISGSIAIQFVASTFAAQARRSLGTLLLVEYVLLLIVAVGLILMALGTKKLKRIEEV